MTLQINGKTFTSQESILAQLLIERGFTGNSLIVELNGIIIPASDYAITSLHENDVLEVLAIMGGG